MISMNIDFKLTISQTEKNQTELPKTASLLIITIVYGTIVN